MVKIILALFIFFSAIIEALAQNNNEQESSVAFYFNQICIDTIFLPIYIPTEDGIEILDKIINMKHQNFIEFPNGTFEISEKKSQQDTVIDILYYDVNTMFYAQYGWDSFKGILNYQGHDFIITSRVSDDTINVLFIDTGQTMGFPEYSDKLFVKIGEKIIWRFRNIDGKFIFSYVYPPSSILEFNPGEMDLPHFSMASLLI